MTLLLNCQNLTKSFGPKTLFQNLNFSIFSNDKLGLIGPNGSGKSTLLKTLVGIESLESGTISKKTDLKIAYVSQKTEFKPIPPKQVLLNTLKEDKTLPEYDKERVAETWLSKLGFKGDEPIASILSGGWKKRLAIAAELTKTPDLLLLDEPTNHLDLEGILWFEEFLDKNVPTYIIISHDRTFLKNQTNRILEINSLYPEGLFEIKGSYEDFEEKKRLFIEGQLKQERSIASKYRRETDWLKESPKARTTKSQSRIDRAQNIIQQYEDIKQRNRPKTATIQFDSSQRQTRKLLVAKNLNLQLGKRLLFENLSFTLSPQTRIGLMGPNGSGKTSLLRLLQGEFHPDSGTIKKAEDLKIVYFDQHREQLPPNTTLKEALSPSGDYVTFRGQSIHVNGWCRRFLFSPDLLGMPIKKLSGGEKARIAVAHLMLKPADILLLDEPTNDLDIATLEILEESLMEFSGAIVLITHDRLMLSRVCNHFLVFGNPKNIQSYAEYAQWEQAEQNQSTKPKLKPIKSKPSHETKKAIRQVEKQITLEEKKLEKLKEELSKVNNTDITKLQELCSQISNSEKELESLYHKWEKLESNSS